MLIDLLWPIAPTNNTAQLMIEPVYSITSAMQSLFSNISTMENRAIEIVDLAVMLVG